ncbi:MAG TPA: very short patch repair endonuclease [Gammaproteobacteria bacterium]|nr:very short patch repair endonuclease [Gammaproteobacteria bacterium]
MTDVFTKEKRSEVMSRVRGKGNIATELKLIKLFREYGITGWRRNYRLFGKPDFVFPARRVAVFVDGEFWHGHPTRGQIPKSNREFWVRKIQRSKARDRLVNKTLKSKGWVVVRIWQHQLKTSEWRRKLMKGFRAAEKKAQSASSNKTDSQQGK